MKAASGYLTLSFSKQEAEETLERKHQKSNNHPHSNRLHVKQHLGWHRFTCNNRKKLFILPVYCAKVIDKKFIVEYIIIRILYIMK